MTATVDEQMVADLLVETARAHHRAFLDTDGFDPEWPIWYARHLHAPLAGALDIELTMSQIVYLLVGADIEHRRREPEAPWAPWYAAYFNRTELEPVTR
jgi:hypothetical protein